MDKTNSTLCGDKAKTFEPLACAVDWLIANSRPNCLLWLGYQTTTSKIAVNNIMAPKNEGS